MKIICLHAHESNYIYMEKIFEQTSPSLVHLVYRMSAEKKTVNQADLETAIAHEITPDVIGIVITCTVYSGIVSSKEIKGIPVLKIEDPLIETLVADSYEKILFFSNPQTVALTMKKVEAAYKDHGLRKDYQVVIIPDVFSLILSNQKRAYRQALLDYINKYIGENFGNLYLMQLSMSIITSCDVMSEKQELKTVFSEAVSQYRKRFTE